MLHFANNVLPAHAAMNGLGFALIDPSLVTSGSTSAGSLPTVPPLMRGLAGIFCIRAFVARIP